VSQALDADETIFAMSKPSFWGRSPEWRRPIIERGRQVGTTNTYFVLGNKDDRDAPSAVIVRFAPDAVIVHHSHPCERMEIVIQGSPTVGDKPGDVTKSGANEMYGPRYPGPDGSTSVKISSTARDSELITYATPRGDVTLDLPTDTPRPDDVIELDRNTIRNRISAPTCPHLVGRFC
jgi:hypothetical protein